MVALTTLLLLLLAGGASLFAAWTIGASSTGSTPFAPAVGANAISTMRAAFIVGLLGFAGAVLQGAAVTETIGQELIVGETLTPLAATVALLIGAIYIAAGAFKGYPIATAFAISGSVVGVGLAMGGAPAWSRYTEIVAYWLLTPVAVTPAAYVTTKLLRSENVSNRVVVPVLAAAVGLIVANMEFLVLGPSGEEGSIALSLAGFLPGSTFAGQVGASLLIAGGLAAYMASALERDAVATQRHFLLALGALVAFTAGGGKVGLAVGPMLPLTESVFGSPMMVVVLSFGAVGILFGSWMMAPRMIKALSQDYSALGPRRSIGVLIPSFAIAQVGIFYGIPMAFNEIFISAIAGTGLAAGEGGVSRSKLFYTVLAWIGSLVFSLVVGYGVYAGISALTGVT